METRIKIWHCGIIESSLVHWGLATHAANPTASFLNNFLCIVRYSHFVVFFLEPKWDSLLFTSNSYVLYCLLWNQLEMLSFIHPEKGIWKFAFLEQFTSTFSWISRNMKGIWKSSSPLKVFSLQVFKNIPPSHQAITTITSPPHTHQRVPNLPLPLFSFTETLCTSMLRNAFTCPDKYLKKDTFHFLHICAWLLYFLPVAKPTGHRKVRVVVVGGYFEVMTLKIDLRSRSTWPLLSYPYLPPIIFFGVGSVTPWPDFSSGWDPSPLDQISLWGGFSPVYIEWIIIAFVRMESLTI